MRILALDSSGLVASVAVVEKIEEEEQVIAEYTSQLPVDRVHLPGFASAPPQRKVWDLP